MLSSNDTLPSRRTRSPAWIDWLDPATAVGGALSRSIMYAEPELLPLSSSPTNPTMAVAPLIATEKPNWSDAAPSEAVSLPSSTHSTPS